ncbi:MAG: hypothetical protein KAJ49_07895 [Arcobacteraceae bacterium]|nr:hypothetical protein [Arcobacteraceae bacterium]
MALQVDFNNAVLYLEQKKYLQAIRLFKKTAKILKIPSFLNIGIAYYKLDSINNAYLYLKKIYDVKEAASQDVYSYISSSYYLYLITNDRKYITTILDVVKTIKKKKISSHVKRLVADTYILLKEYEKAIRIIKTMKDKDLLKLALLYIKTKDYVMADINLQKAYENTKNDKMMNKILWLQVFRDLKANDTVKIQDHIDVIISRKKIFNANRKMPLKIYFNKDKYSSEQYFNRVVKFSQDRKIDMIFYFAPFIFVDKKEIYNDSSFGFVLKNQQNINSLDMMIEYNKKFIDIVKDDPIIRVNKLQKIVDEKYDTKSYEYYNLAVSYAQIDNFSSAYKYFKKAYDLNHANKLYSAMALISAKRADIDISKVIEKKISQNLLAKGGEYPYLGKYIYKLIYNPKYKLNPRKLTNISKRSIFLRALYFLEHINENGINEDEPLLKADVKDPLVFLFRELVKLKDESRYNYISRLQDTIPKVYNDYFLKGPLIITQYYIDLLKGLGIFDRVDFHIKGEISPTYLRTKALVQLYDGYPVQSIKILEHLQEKYNLNDKYTSYLIIASFLRANDYSNASATLGMLEFELNDNDAKFLNGVQLLQSLKLNSARRAFKNKYKGFLIDFKLEGFDDYLESL